VRSCTAPCRSDFFDGFTRNLLININSPDGGAFAGKSKRDGAPDAAARAGDDCDFVREP